MNIPHPPASTIKTLLVLTALDELPNLDATVVGTEADTQVECSCAGIKPGRTYTARQLLDAILLMSGNDAANCAGRHDRRLRHRGREDERQGRLDRRARHTCGHTVGTRRGGRLRCHHAARSGRHLPRRDGQSGVRPDHRAARGDVPDRRGRQADRQRRRAAGSAIRARSAARPDSPTRRRRRSSRPPTAAGAGW